MCRQTQLYGTVCRNDHSFFTWSFKIAGSEVTVEMIPPILPEVTVDMIILILPEVTVEMIPPILLKLTADPSYFTWD